MRSIGIVGAGQAGVVLAAALHRDGHQVTLYSDRTPEQYLAGRARPSACLFGDQVAYERKLGLDFWREQAPPITTARLDLGIAGRMVALSVNAPMRTPALAVDQRLKFAHGMRELALRGVRVVIETVTPQRLDEIAATHDLVVVTTGRQGPVGALFRPDRSRCSGAGPRRALFMMCLRDCGLDSGPQANELRFSFVPGVVEVFWIPFYDKDVGPCRNVLLEAVPGGPADRFAGVRGTGQAVAALRRVVRELLPWENEVLDPATPTSDQCWLTGAVSPTVREPVAVLPSGRHVLGLGDTVVLNDPIAGQGANNATRMARFFAQRITARGERPFDAAWLTEQFDQFWEYGRLVNEFSELLLEPLRDFQRDVMLAASRHPSIGTALFGGFEDPASVFPWFVDRRASKLFLAQHGVRPLDVLGTKLGVLGRVLSQRLPWA
ncbi:FAD-dependent oxidoreductase [Kutzneria viridogrisea]|uniref:2-polyprenyl-6-methoxyphenol hydroxylase-like FAD-dependent oxidoreductase n=2 Tax=Kutzneria TaxID=43356 RepID=A0ABR6BQL6_9PSEU|nr:styrene monooxygenase/indole monooxygenase family protein [Kutzneria albida]AHH95859.1 hypothetical protein KALB_2491 [Kutzneria albida DSM 43870]MBA8928941.1 2-polyprenyl-6-methoxyphenol hydroxylase-like FAD-dependent oxidoreductase [Kutzneria viridogrisea]